VDGQARPSSGSRNLRRNEPCFKLGMRMGDAEFVGRFASSGKPGAYLRIKEPGDVGTGDPIITSPPPALGLTVGDLMAVRPSTPVELLESIESIDDVPEG
jgi:MOSC domain-containing protein YiiM